MSVEARTKSLLIFGQDLLDSRDFAQVALTVCDLFVGAGSDSDVGCDSGGSHLVEREKKR